MALEVHLHDLVARAERVQLGPMVEVLDRVVRAVVRAPADEAQQVAAIVEVLLEELARRRHVLGQQLPLQQRPLRRRHRRIDGDRRRRRAGGRFGLGCRDTPTTRTPCKNDEVRTRAG